MSKLQKISSRIISLGYLLIIGVLLLFVLAPITLAPAFGAEVDQTAYNWFLLILGIISISLIGVSIGIWKEKRWGYISGLTINVLIFLIFLQNLFLATIPVFNLPLIVSVVATPFLAFFLIKEIIAAKGNN